MLRDDAISLISDRFGARTDVAVRALSEMKLLQSSLEGSAFLPWFLLTDTTSLVTVANDERVLVPSDFLREAEEDDSYMYILDTSQTPNVRTYLHKSTHALIAEKYKDSLPQQPIEWALTNNYYRFFPIPDAVYQLRTAYYAADTVLTLNIENKWLIECPDLMIAGTGLQLAKYTNDDKLAALFRADYMDALKDLKDLDTARREANMDRSMGDADA